MYKTYIPYLQHILDECLYVRSVIKDDMQIEQFLCDETLKRALLFNEIKGNSNVQIFRYKQSEIG